MTHFLLVYKKTWSSKTIYWFFFFCAVQGLVVQKPVKTNLGYVNADKCESMRITDIRDKSITQYLLDTPLKDVKSFKDLGVTISKGLSWDNHISITVNKANNLLGLIKRSVGTTNENSMLYLSLVRPILEYAVPVWCPYIAKDIRALESIQRRASRLAVNQHKGEIPYVHRCKLLKWSSLSHVNLYILLMHIEKTISAGNATK